jgi:nucleotide-binding universal stress UspA family protein
MLVALEEISRILVPVDGSKSSVVAAEAAIKLAKRYSGRAIRPGTKVTTRPSVEVIALYVVDVSPRLELFGKFGFDYAAREKDALERARKVTRAWFSQIKEKADAHNVGFRSEVRDNSSSSVVGEIIDFAERENVDVIVIGTRGQSEYKKLLMGSVSSAVVTYAPCTVIIVRKKEGH